MYQEDGDVNLAYDTLVSGNWARTFLIGKPRAQISNFKEHVRISFLYMYNNNSAQVVLSWRHCLPSVVNFYIVLNPSYLSYV